MDPTASQQEIDRAIADLRGLEGRGPRVSSFARTVPSQGQIVKLALLCVGGAGVVISALFHFWFAQISDVPIRYPAAWKVAVDQRLERTDDDHARLGAVVQDVDSLKGAVNRVHSELKDVRADQLEFYRWQAERAGDRPRARRLSAMLKAAKE